MNVIGIIKSSAAQKCLRASTSRYNGNVLRLLQCPSNQHYYLSHVFMHQLIIPSTQANEPSTQAFILALLTAGGGLTGYIRTGSVPSVAAGMTVGALVLPPSPTFRIRYTIQRIANKNNSTDSAVFESATDNHMVWNWHCWLVSYWRGAVCREQLRP